MPDAPQLDKEGNPTGEVVTVERDQGLRETTVEGLANGETLSRVQQAFLAEGAAQCGYCTAGILIAATALIDSDPKPTRDDILAALDPHLCRCGSHARVLAAIDRLIAEA